MTSPYLSGIDWGTQLPSNSVAYYFVPASPTHSSPLGDVETFALSAYEMQQIERALADVTTFANVSFHQVGSEGAADLFFMTSDSADMGTSILGAAEPPGEPGAGEVLFNRDGRGWQETLPGSGALEQGGYGYVTIIHEIGHALGLAHPHDTGGTSTIFPGVSSSGDTGTDDLNQGVFTTMSYITGWATGPAGNPTSGAPYGWQGGYMAFDIAVLQAKYGANTTFRTGDDVYAIPDANGVGTYFSCIWDAGGNDTIAYQGTRDVTIDLRAATLQTGEGAGGWVSYADGVHGGFTIANGVLVENAGGGGGADTLIGNAAANVLDGGVGGDRMAAAGGDDTYIVDNAGDVVDESIAGSDGVDTVFASVSFNLGDVNHAFGAVEHLTLSGPEAIDATGNDLANWLTGNGGNNTLAGRGGADRLVGGDGADRFFFNTPIFKTPENRDVVEDFNPAADTFAFDNAIFKKLGGEGFLRHKYFHEGGQAHDHNDHLIYSNRKDVLIYDWNGDDKGGAKIVAVVLGDFHLKAADFLVL